jgi:predicted CXXCH cytochrome family protein
MTGPPRRICQIAAALQGTVGGLLLILAGTGMLIGCSTPQERYEVLSFFFDGVPDPAKANSAAEKGASDGPVATAVVMTLHKPYVNNQCDACHRLNSGEIAEFQEAYKACVKCHEQVTTQYQRMHGPVALGVCAFCHTAHESVEPALLKDSPVKVCGHCHESDMLSDTVQQHKDPSISCLSCHFGHGGPERYFLKQPTVARREGTPATMPSSGEAKERSP